MTGTCFGVPDPFKNRESARKLTGETVLLTLGILVGPAVSLFARAGGGTFLSKGGGGDTMRFSYKRRLGSFFGFKI